MLVFTSPAAACHLSPSSSHPRSVSGGRAAAGRQAAVPHPVSPVRCPVSPVWAVSMRRFIMLHRNLINGGGVVSLRSPAPAQPPRSAVLCWPQLSNHQLKNDRNSAWHQQPPPPPPRGHSLVRGPGPHHTRGALSTAGRGARWPSWRIISMDAQAPCNSCCHAVLFSTQL